MPPTTSFPPPFPQPYTKVEFNPMVEFKFSKPANVEALTNMLVNWFPGEPGLVVAPDPHIEIRFMIGRQPLHSLTFFDQENNPGPSYAFNHYSIFFPVLYNDVPYLFNPYRFTDNALLMTWEREFLGLQTAEAQFDVGVAGGGSPTNIFGLTLEPLLPMMKDSTIVYRRSQQLNCTKLLDFSARDMTWKNMKVPHMAETENILALRQFQQLGSNWNKACLSEIVSIRHEATVTELLRSSSPVHYLNDPSTNYVDFFLIKDILVPRAGLLGPDVFQIFARSMSYKIYAGAVLKKYR